jgi:hypothetical protein
MKLAAVTGVVINMFRISLSEEGASIFFLKDRS